MSAIAENWMPRSHGSKDLERLSLFVEKVPAGWRLDLGGRVRHFGTGFMALQTATDAARAAAGEGRPARVFVERPDGGWRTVWNSDEPYAA